MAERSNKAPAGVVLVFLDERGRVVAHAADFNRDVPAGFDLDEIQRRRAKLELAFAVCNAYASPHLVRGLERYDCERIVERLCSAHGCKVHEITVGHDAPAEE
ncbi:MAG: hypothetical protein AB7P99_04850 [Vicinamibacterales bacterium]